MVIPLSGSFPMSTWLFHYPGYSRWARGHSAIRDIPDEYVVIPLSGSFLMSMWLFHYPGHSRWACGYSTIRVISDEHILEGSLPRSGHSRWAHTGGLFTQVGTSRWALWKNKEEKVCPDISHMVFQALVILMRSACQGRLCNQTRGSTLFLAPWHHSGTMRTWKASRGIQRRW